MSNNVASDESKYNYEMTNCPDIYEGWYWSEFKYPEASGPEIIDNRNRFAAEYNIRKIKKDIPEYVEKKCPTDISLDHMEYYMTEDEYICISSNYGNEIHENALNFGFTKLPYSLYSGCTTMIKTVPKRRRQQ